jgi:hypothetical protein
LDIVDPDFDQDFFCTSQSLSGEPWQDILAAHASNEVCKLLDANQAVYPGGYALALYNSLLDPSKDLSAQISKDLYSDIDVMSITPDQTYALANMVKAQFKVVKEYRTPRATTLWVEQPHGPQVFQFVASWGANPLLAMSGFDYDNCKIAFSPRDGFYIHTNVNDLLLNNCLQLSEDWEELDSLNKLSLSIVRAVKYCKRWGWRLDARSLNRLTSCWLALPNSDKWEPVSQVDSGKLVVSNEPNADNTDTLGRALMQLYALHDRQVIEEFSTIPDSPSELVL